MVTAALAGPVAPATASADSSVLVLGIRSVDGDDDFARNLTRALQNAAAQVSGWTLNHQEVTLAQLALAYACDPPGPACLTEMAAALEVDRLLYGDVRRTSHEEDYEFAIELHLFNADSARIESSVVDRHPRQWTDIDDLREPARGWVSRLAGASPTGRVRIESNVPRAAVFLGDEQVGRTGPDGVFRLDDLGEGNRQLRIEAAGYVPRELTVRVMAHQEATVQVQLDRASRSGPDRAVVTGAALLVAGAFLAGGWIYTLIRLDDLNGNQDYVAYRQVVGEAVATGMPVTGNVCANARARNTFGLIPDNDPILARAQDVCSTGSTHEVLQWVFLGTAAATLTAGAILLAVGLAHRGDRPERVLLLPDLGPRRASLTVRVAF
ncbi:MAG: carboxypeptidase-like regulatory domain-containing protein [Sandaracinaceae bacterium]